MEMNSFHPDTNIHNNFPKTVNVAFFWFLAPAHMTRQYAFPREVHLIVGGS